jgi:hypothetical protein
VLTACIVPNVRIADHPDNNTPSLPAQGSMSDSACSLQPTMSLVCCPPSAAIRVLRWSQSDTARGVAALPVHNTAALLEGSKPSRRA